MADDRERNIYLEFLRFIKEHSKFPEECDAPLRLLQEYAISKGLDNPDVDLLIDLIINSGLNASSLISLTKCLIPRHKLDSSTAKNIVAWYLSVANTLPVTVSIIWAQWLIGMWDYKMMDEKILNIFYNVFFNIMLKNEKLERHIARIIYGLTKPEDVTRRDVSRLLALHKKRAKVQKHVVVLLSLFKSYKPELVPESISSINTESVWTPIPEVLRVSFENAKLRLQSIQSENYSNSNALAQGDHTETVLLPVKYFQIGSSIFEEKEIDIEELGKWRLYDELSGENVTLVHNTAGYHLLTFSDFRYQSKFSYNLYHTLMNALTSENDLSAARVKKLLEMTAEFSRYMQQGIPVVNRFLEEYLYFNTGEYQSELMALLQWMTSVSIDDLQKKTLIHVQNMFYESAISGKCEIIRALKMLITNWFVNQGFNNDSIEDRPAPFLGQRPVDHLKDSIPILTKICGNLIVSGLNIHSFHVLLLSEALSFYEEISTLENWDAISSFTIAPPAVVYGCFIAKHCIFLSRICKLLSRYHDRCIDLKSRGMQNRFQGNADIVSIYIKDISRALWYNAPFKQRSQGYFLKSIPEQVLINLKHCNLDHLLNISNHFAMLPFRCTLNKTGLTICTNEQALCMATHYCPSVKEFLDISQKYQ